MKGVQSVEIKGMSIIPTVEFVRQRFGDEGYRRWLDALHPETRETLSVGVLPSTWYPLDDLFVKPTLAICDLFFGGDRKGAWELGRFSADFALRGAYKIFVKIGTPGWMVKRATRILPSYYRPARGELLESSSTMARFRICDLIEPTGTAELRIAGWLERGLEISGARNCKVKILKSQSTGDVCPEIEMTWT
jgi:hypothetical protein